MRLARLTPIKPNIMLPNNQIADGAGAVVGYRASGLNPTFVDNLKIAGQG